ncbi:MAG: DNA (cytosine-5-)-methyltransferase, partial [Phenylobacterium sp.]
MSRAETRLDFLEFFAGGGMARLGLGLGWSCLFANDFDPVKGAAYRANFADAEAHFSGADVWNLSAADLPGPAAL